MTSSDALVDVIVRTLHSTSPLFVSEVHVLLSYCLPAGMLCQLGGSLGEVLTDFFKDLRKSLGTLVTHTICARLSHQSIDRCHRNDSVLLRPRQGFLSS